MTLVAHQELDALVQFLQLAPVGLVQIAPDGEIAAVNPLAAQLLRPLQAEDTPRNLFDVLQGVAPDLRSRVRDYADSQGTVLDAMQLLVKPPSAAASGDVEVLSLTLLKLDGLRLMAMVSDITAQVRRERELQQCQAWIHSIVKGVADHGLTTLDEQGLCREWNAGMGRVTGYDAEALVGRTPALFSANPSAADDRLRERLREADAAGWSLDEDWMARPDGTRYWGSTLITPLRSHEPALGTARSYSLVVRDISHLRESRESLRPSVSGDPLTGLANRRAFFEGGEAAVAHGLHAPRPLSMLMIGADDLDRIADAHGHAVADAVLRHLAAGLATTCRGTDLVARVAGGTFAALLPGADTEQALRVARRLCQAIAAQQVQVDGRPIRYAVSAGVASFEAGVDGIEGLFARADGALLEARRQGSPRVARWTAQAAPELLAPAIALPGSGDRPAC